MMVKGKRKNDKWQQTVPVKNVVFAQENSMALTLYTERSWTYVMLNDPRETQSNLALLSYTCFMKDE